MLTPSSHMISFSGLYPAGFPNNMPQDGNSVSSDGQPINVRRLWQWYTHHYVRETNVLRTDEILTVENDLSALPVGDNENAATEVMVNEAKIGSVNFMVVVVDGIVSK